MFWMSRRTGTNNIFQWLKQGLAASPNVRALQHREVAVRAAVTASTLVDRDAHGPRMAGNTSPRLLVVHLRPTRLLVQEVEVVHELRVGHLSAKDGNRSETLQ